MPAVSSRSRNAFTPASAPANNGSKRRATRTEPTARTSTRTSGASGATCRLGRRAGSAGAAPVRGLRSRVCIRVRRRISRLHRAEPAGSMADPMRRAVFVLFAVALLTPAATATAQERDGASVVVAEVDGSIDRTVAEYLGDVIAEAETNGSTLVLQLDSAGTLDEDAVGLAERIHEASVPVIVWVGPAPAKARGAALLFMYAASLGAMAPGAGAGPLTPLDLGDRADPTRAELADLIDMWTTERGRSVTEPFPAEPLPAQRALDLGIADVAAVSVVELLEEIDERTVSTATGDVTLQTRIAREESEDPVDVRFVDLGPWDRTLHAAASPTWIYVLMVLGLAGLAFELTQSGLGFAGIASVLMLALAVYGMTVVPFSWLGPPSPL